jgi:hypothetical protein
MNNITKVPLAGFQNILLPPFQNIGLFYKSRIFEHGVVHFKMEEIMFIDLREVLKQNMHKLYSPSGWYSNFFVWTTRRIIAS